MSNSAGSGECTPDRGCDDEEECVHGRCRPVDPSDCMEEGCPGDAVCHPDLRRCVWIQIRINAVRTVIVDETSSVSKVAALMASGGL